MEPSILKTSGSSTRIRIQSPTSGDRAEYASVSISQDESSRDKNQSGEEMEEQTVEENVQVTNEEAEGSLHRRRKRHDADGDSVDSHEDREMTLKDRQDAINRQHPFGLPIWKPALYKKSRSVVRRANSALHSSPSSSPELFLNPGNILWAILFGWWLACAMLVISIILSPLPPDGQVYGRVMRELAYYLLWPFGRYVERHVDCPPSSIDDAFAGETSRRGKKSALRRCLEILRSGPAGCVYYLLFILIVAPLLLLVSTISWLCVVTIPMAKLHYILVRHLRRHPLSLRFKRISAKRDEIGRPAVILLCTYQAIGLQYYKYTYDGINIIFINLIPLVFFVIFDQWVLKRYWYDSITASSAVVFCLSLASVIPLSYFIGMGISSVSAQSSMGVGAVINATFGSIIEIILYVVALMNGKSALVEGALIGSFIAGVLLMPGCSMVSSGTRRKEQKFNAKSAGVTSTMLIMAIIGALTPTLFYKTFGSIELRCTGCPEVNAGTISCSQCYYDQMNPTIDPVYQNSVKPLTWICAAILPSAYVIGLVFSLRTHVDMVWKTPSSSGKTNEPYYQKLIPAQIISHLVHPQHPSEDKQHKQKIKPHAMVSTIPLSVPSTSTTLTREQTSYASINTAAAVPQGHGLLSYGSINTGAPALHSPQVLHATHHPAGQQAIQPSISYAYADDDEDREEEEEEIAGHDSPNWGKTKSFTILFVCTLLYSIIAEVLVETVDEVMEHLTVDEKFLGLTLFALVPNITEFMNAISFALNGNVVLSLEIGSAYALQVCLLQIPAMVVFSLWYNWGKEELSRYTFT
ncbi:hypothetical protein DFQ29_009012 [Apophysomyces sp. BC1021]|nr:hypothetical protein DFQ29_009012 [Apophysomyces sp. BC1021]